MKGLIISFAVALLVVTISCSNSSEPEKQFKDPRDMTWTVDTLSQSVDAGQLLPKSMIAFGSNNVWLACWSDVAQKVMWHYDGKIWNESDIEKQSGPIGLDALAGNSSSDLWAGGFYDVINNKIALSHYNGFEWTRVDLKISGEILDMCTDASGNVWACGRNGVVLEYTQGKWIADTVKINFNYPVEYFLKSIAYYNNKIYILVTSINKNTLAEKYFYLYGDMNNWTIADSMTLDLSTSSIKWGYRDLHTKDNKYFYSYGISGIWEYQGSVWNKIKTVNGAINGIYCADKNYILGVGDFKKVEFYNGSNWDSISDLFIVSDPTFVFKNVWTDGYEIFITGYGTVNNNERTIIWHGK